MIIWTSDWKCGFQADFGRRWQLLEQSSPNWTWGRLPSSSTKPRSTAPPHYAFMTTKKSTLVYCRHLVMGEWQGAMEISSKKGLKRHPARFIIQAEKEHLQLVMIREKSNELSFAETLLVRIWPRGHLLMNGEWCSWCSLSYILWLRRTKGQASWQWSPFLRTCFFLDRSGSSLGRKIFPHPESWFPLCLSPLTRPARRLPSWFRFSTPSHRGIFCVCVYVSLYVTSYYEFSAPSGKSLKRSVSWAWTL